MIEWNKYFLVDKLVFLKIQITCDKTNFTVTSYGIYLWITVYPREAKLSILMYTTFVCFHYMNNMHLVIICWNLIEDIHCPSVLNDLMQSLSVTWFVYNIKMIKTMKSNAFEPHFERHPLLLRQKLKFKLVTSIIHKMCLSIIIKMYQTNSNNFFLIF